MADISMIRGDDVYVYLLPTIDGVGVALEEGDLLRFKVFAADGSVMISKTATVEDQDENTLEITIKIAAADTESLDISAPTVYRWEGELYSAESGDYCTPFYQRTLEIKPDDITPGVRGA